MQLRCTAEAAQDLERNTDYHLTHAPAPATELARADYDAPSALLAFPNRGRPGRREGTRELVLSPLPYIVVYAVRADVVFVVRILHGAQQWP
jgi:plasmid stabilization system protein ParE